jgi:hypothetical protein
MGMKITFQNSKSKNIEAEFRAYIQDVQTRFLLDNCSK